MREVFQERTFLSLFSPLLRYFHHTVFTQFYFSPSYNLTFQCGRCDVKCQERERERERERLTAGKKKDGGRKKKKEKAEAEIKRYRLWGQFCELRNCC